jgi:hypothetical protein
MNAQARRQDPDELDEPFADPGEEKGAATLTAAPLDHAGEMDFRVTQP